MQPVIPKLRLFMCLLNLESTPRLPPSCVTGDRVDQSASAKESRLSVPEVVHQFRGSFSEHGESDSESEK
jgi:hypothetical protein